MLRVSSLCRQLNVTIWVCFATGCDGPIPEAPWLTAVDQASHQVYFPLLGGAHRSAHCDDCHGQFDTFTRFSCIGCHEHSASEMNPAHGAVSDYEFTEMGCLGCHPSGEKLGISVEAHARFFPIGQGSVHQEQSCRDCHSGSKLSCIGCHHEPGRTASEHGRVGGFSAETEPCLKCHYDSSVPNLSAHMFRIDLASNHPPRQTGCLECHRSLRSGWAIPAADFSVYDCTVCHQRREMDDEHQDEVNYRYESRSCTQSGCHLNGEAD